MNDNNNKLNIAEVSQKKGNLKLATQFMREYLEEPDRYGPIPMDAAVILLPPEDQGDPELRRANLRMAEELAAEGRDIVLWTVGPEEPDAPQMLAGQRPFPSQDN